MMVVHLGLSSAELDNLVNGEVLNKSVDDIFIRVHHEKRDAEMIEKVCAEEGCEEEAKCFIYTRGGVQSLCFNHYRKKK